jgi:hypothetical protein
LKSGGGSTAVVIFKPLLVSNLLNEAGLLWEQSEQVDKER